MTDATEFAWKLHAAQEAWTTRADAKASVLFTIEGAFVATVVAVLSSPTMSPTLRGWREVFLAIGLCAAVLAALLAGLAIVPRIGSRRVLNSEKHVIYFGHLRSWTAEDLATEIEGLTPGDQVSQLSVQLVRLSESNWTKYSRLRMALASTAVAALFVIVALAWPR